MGIQQGINTMLGTAGVAAAATKHLREEHKRNVMTAMGFRNQFSAESNAITDEADKLELEGAENGYLDNVNEQMWDKGMSETNNFNDMSRRQRDMFEARVKRLEENLDEKIENKKTIEKLYETEFKQLDELINGKPSLREKYNNYAIKTSSLNDTQEKLGNTEGWIIGGKK